MVTSIEMIRAEWKKTVPCYEPGDRTRSREDHAHGVTGLKLVDALNNKTCERQTAGPHCHGNHTGKEENKELITASSISS